LLYRLNREVANRELEREYEAQRSAQQYKDAEGLGFVIFILIIIDSFIPSWVFGPWFHVFSVFLILGIAVGIHDSFKLRFHALPDSTSSSLNRWQRLISEALVFFPVPGSLRVR